mgnify:CR=1 FL=1
MKKEKVDKLEPGMYVIRWKKNTYPNQSLAIVGVDCENGRWLCCCNWNDILDQDVFYDNWEDVKSAQLTMSLKEFNDQVLEVQVMSDIENLFKKGLKSQGIEL